MARLAMSTVLAWLIVVVWIGVSLASPRPLFNSACGSELDSASTSVLPVLKGAEGRTHI